MIRIIASWDDPDPEIQIRRHEIQAEIATLLKRLDVLKADRKELRRSSRTDDGVLDEAVALIQQMETDDLTARFEIRQRLHTLLRRIVEVAHFSGGGVGYARVQIRGGMVLEIPLDETTPVRAGSRMGGHPAFTRQPRDSDTPPLEPNEFGTKLIATE